MRELPMDAGQCLPTESSQVTTRTVFYFGIFWGQQLGRAQSLSLSLGSAVLGRRAVLEGVLVTEQRCSPKPPPEPGLQLRASSPTAGS